MEDWKTRGELDSWLANDGFVVDFCVFRPTKPAAWWEGGEILGGRDEVAGGTWLACSRGGRLAFITNVLELHTLPEAKSRGDLPSGKSPREFAEEVAREGHYYNGFNLIVADLSSNAMVYVSNRPKGEPISIQDVPPCTHVLSNAKLNSPWHKVQRLELNFNDLIGEYGEGEIPVNEMVEKLMRDRVKAEESKLPRICSLDWELV
ncbi:hypothetical protein RHMOL_Rhmol06G0014500 [Rhododendron molle]|uniref:Uncharacterized protein n=1 Tax=Rhododendron molle TaxID=49168 RepID=A0ACC0N9T7_RHOML|nr:hypothetical protein RHMOL_Rhmol06G0014500 [Rhododendron molle]